MTKSHKTTKNFIFKRFINSLLALCALLLIHKLWHLQFISYKLSPVILLSFFYLFVFKEEVKSLLKMQIIRFSFISYMLVSEFKPNSSLNYTYIGYLRDSVRCFFLSSLTYWHLHYLLMHPFCCREAPAFWTTAIEQHNSTKMSTNIKTF